MSTGYLLLLALGICWTFVAIILSEAKSKNCSIFAFYCIGSFLATLLLLLWGGLSLLKELILPEKRFAVGCFAVCAIFNGIGQGITMWNLKKGGRALAYAIPQLSFLLSFVWSIFFWSQQLNWRSASGIVLIVTAVVFLSMCKQQKNSSELELKRVFISIGAMMLCGFSQILLITPTQLPSAEALSPLTGSCVIQASNALFFLILLLCRYKQEKSGIKPAVKYGIFWGFFASCAYCVLLPTLRILGEIGQSGIVFAVGSSMTILLFSAFTVIRFREKLTLSQWAAFATIVAGIFLVKL